MGRLNMRTLQSCWPEDSSSNGCREKQREHANRTTDDDVAVLMMIRCTDAMFVLCVEGGRVASRLTISLLCNGLSQSSGDETDGDGNGRVEKEWEGVSRVEEKHEHNT